MQDIGASRLKFMSIADSIRVEEWREREEGHLKDT